MLISWSLIFTNLSFFSSAAVLLLLSGAAVFAIVLVGTFGTNYIVMIYNRVNNFTNPYYLLFGNTTQCPCWLISRCTHLCIISYPVVVYAMNFILRPFGSVDRISIGIVVVYHLLWCCEMVLNFFVIYCSSIELLKQFDRWREKHRQTLEVFPKTLGMLLMVESTYEDESYFLNGCSVTLRFNWRVLYGTRRVLCEFRPLQSLKIPFSNVIAQSDATYTPWQ